MKGATIKQKYDQIMEKKISTPIEQLSRGYASEFSAFLHYTRSLKFEDKPDYGYLRKLFREVFVREGFSYDNVFDWNEQGLDTDGYLDTKNLDAGNDSKGDEN